MPSANTALLSAALKNPLGSSWNTMTVPLSWACALTAKTKIQTISFILSSPVVETHLLVLETGLAPRVFRMTLLEQLATTVDAKLSCRRVAHLSVSAQTWGAHSLRSLQRGGLPKYGHRRPSRLSYSFT